MSVMAVAPRIVLDGPLPRPPAYSLLTVAQEAAGDDHWRAGANIYPYPASLPSGHDPCSDGTFREKDAPTPVVLPDAFPAFTAYLGEICSSFGIGEWDEFRNRANVALAAREAYALERQLVAAEFVDAPSLGGVGVSILGGGAVSPLVAYAYLEGAIADSGQAGVIHSTPQVVSYLGFNTLRDDRGVLRTAAGTPVVSGHGYNDAPAPTGGGAAAAGQSWIYATGPVLYRRVNEIYNHPETLAEALDRSDNTVIYRAERDLWVGWDMQVHVAVLADWSP